MPPVIQEMTYDNVFSFPYEFNTQKNSLQVRFLSPQFQLLVTTGMLYSLFSLTSGTHSIYVGTIKLLGAWRQVFMFIWRPLSRRSRLLNRVRQFLSIVALVCIQADLLSGIAQSISLCTPMETGLMLSIYQLTRTRFLDGDGFLSGQNVFTIQQGMVQIIASSASALPKNWLQMLCDLFHFWDGARYLNGLSTGCHGGGLSIFMTIITLLVGRMPLLTDGLPHLLVRKRWSSALLVMFMLINWLLNLFRDPLLGRWLSWRSVIARKAALTTIAGLKWIRYKKMTS